MSISRRHFIGASTSLFLMGSPVKNLNAQIKSKKNLVIISLRGGMDGLTAVPFVGDTSLAKFRPEINVDSKLKLNSDFRLHPKLKYFYKLWKKKKAAIIHATSIPYTGRSHFEGQDLMETGGELPYQYGTGWLGRGIDVAGLEGLAVSLPMPLLIRSNSNHDNFFPSRIQLPSDKRLKKIAATYSKGTDLDKTMQRILHRPISMLETSYSDEALDLARTASLELAKLDGPRIAVFDLGGFDTHAAQGGENGTHGDKLEILDELIEELKNGMGEVFDDTLVLTLTEFGRKLEQNGGYGTEHGYGSAIIAAGGLLKKAQVYTDWPGLKKKDLFEGRDLNVTLDARSVYCAAMAACFDTDFEKLRREAFFGADLKDVTTDLFDV